jgi:hypothetical protein
LPLARLEMASSKRTSAGSAENGAPHSEAVAATKEDERPPRIANDGETQVSEPAGDAPPNEPKKAPEEEGPGEATRATRPAPTPPSPEPTRSERFAALAERVHLGVLATGIALIVFGVLLLGGTQIAWRGFLDAILAVVGLILIVGSRRAAGRRGLLVVGLILAIILLGVWRADVPLTGGLRFSTVTPTTPQTLPTTLRQSGGTLTIDLRHYRPAPLTPPQQVQQVQASIGVGRLVVLIPPLTLLQGGISVGEGRTVVAGADRNGVGLEVPMAAPNVPALVRLDLRVGVGTVEVQVVKPS